jgi:hypothetical protein
MASREREAIFVWCLFLCMLCQAALVGGTRRSDVGCCDLWKKVAIAGRHADRLVAGQDLTQLPQFG